MHLIIHISLCCVILPQGVYEFYVEKPILCWAGLKSTPCFHFTGKYVRKWKGCDKNAGVQKGEIKMCIPGARIKINHKFWGPYWPLVFKKNWALFFSFFFYSGSDLFVCFYLLYMRYWYEPTFSRAQVWTFCRLIPNLRAIFRFLSDPHPYWGKRRKSAMPRTCHGIVTEPVASWSLGILELIWTIIKQKQEIIK